MHVLSKDEKISVLIPMFNRERFIGDSLKSILNQTYFNFQVIVYDDGSDDKSVSIVKKFCKIDERVTLIEGKENRGVAFARNCLLEACDTKFACWQDSDDLSNIYRLEIQRKEINNSILVFVGHRRMTTNEKILLSEEPQDFTLQRPAYATLMFPVDKSIHFYNEKILGGEDAAWYKLMEKKYKMIFIPKVLYYVRFHSNRIGMVKNRLRRLSELVRQGKSYKELLELL